MDISDTLAPTSDQLDAVDLLGGPRIFTIEKVARHNAEQPVNVHLAEFPRVWRPGKSMRRVMAAAWGTDTSKWIGQRVELFCDSTVVFGGAEVGGTRISRMSGIGKVHKTPLLVKRGKSAVFTVQPLPDAPAPAPEPTESDVSACDDVAVLRGWWQQSGDERRAQIQARVAELNAPADTPAEDPTPDAPWGETLPVEEQP